MKSLLKLILYLGGLVLVILTAGIITIASLDPNEHKDWISKQVMERTGRRLLLEGDVDLTFYPWLGVEANRITVGNAAGFGDEPFLYAEYLKLRIKLMPMFKDHYEIDTVNIHGSVINLAVNDKGVTNWADLVSAEKPDDRAAFPLAAVVLGGVDVQDASVDWRDAGSDTHYKVRNMDIKTDALRFGEPLKLVLGMEVSANKPALDGKVGLQGTLAYDLDNQLYNIRPLQLEATLKGANIPGGRTRGTLTAAIELNLDTNTVTISDLAVDALDTQVQGKLSASRIHTPKPSVQAGIKVNGSDLSQLFKVAEIEPLATQIAKLADRSFRVTTSLDADLERGDIDISELDLAMLGATVQGDVKVRNVSSESPGYKGQLKAAGPDLPTLMQVLGRFQGGSKSALTTWGLKFAGVKQKAFRIVTGFDADLKSGDIDIPELDIDTLGLQVQGNLQARNMQADSGAVSGKLAIRGKDLAQLMVALDQKPLSEVLQSISLDVGVAGNAAALNLKPMLLKATLAGEQVGKSPVDVSLQADTRVNLDKQILNMDGLTLKGLGLNVSGRLDASKIMEAPEFSGEMIVAPFNLRALMRKLNQELPDSADRKVYTKAGLNTRFAGSAKHLQLENLALLLDDSNLKGNISVVDFNKPAIKFALDVDQIDADRYLPPEAKGKGAKPVTPETAAGAAAQLPIETLQALNIDGSFSIGKLTVSKARMSNVKLSIKGKDGNIQIDPIAANLYQGSYTGKISIDANGKLPKLVVNSAIKGVQIEPLLMDVSGKADLVGKSDISIAVVARGNNTEAFKQTLSGQAELRVTNGIFRGVNVPGALEQVEIMLESKRFGKVNTAGNTKFDSLTATLPINAGVVNNDDMVLSAPGFRVLGKGMLARLTDMTWRYDLSVVVDQRSVARGEKRYNIGDYNIPIKCRGKIAGENCTPDKMDLAGKAVQKILIDKLKLPGTGGTAESNATDGKVDPGKEILDKALKSIFQ